MGSPESGSAISVPHTFSWQPRVDVKGYAWVLLSLPEGNIVAESSNRTGTSYILEKLPDGVNTGETYGWTVRVYGEAGSYGYILGYRRCCSIRLRH